MFKIPIITAILICLQSCTTINSNKRLPNYCGVECYDSAFVRLEETIGFKELQNMNLKLVLAKTAKEYLKDSWKPYYTVNAILQNEELYVLFIGTVSSATIRQVDDGFFRIWIRKDTMKVYKKI